jgi:hypothetical protein
VVVVVQRVRPLAQREQRNVERLVLVEALHRAVSGSLVSNTLAFDIPYSKFIIISNSGAEYQLTNDC